ncbi:hypothetical protein VCUG_00204 [Vavraia culicis subsp. floridensis]|uniref:Uncharacterized protein n=1 Tax=Vavraia culicis (isolate floridensis) TaxID=948595 RepID=L2GYN4_VAVCU|nr:uncharacterized protein VCUG_00204 [Vavraia culicis subsp. floridensis]ELA48368.1 hypothetical protein VCUG_00204 [Vavraia culicis subsp. floridensis]
MCEILIGMINGEASFMSFTHYQIYSRVFFSFYCHTFRFTQLKIDYSAIAKCFQMIQEHSYRVSGLKTANYIILSQSMVVQTTDINKFYLKVKNIKFFCFSSSWQNSIISISLNVGIS